MVKDNQTMLHTKFQASELSGSGKEDFFLIFLRISMVQTQETMGQGHFLS